MITADTFEEGRLKQSTSLFRDKLIILGPIGPVPQCVAAKASDKGKGNVTASAGGPGGGSPILGASSGALGPKKNGMIVFLNQYCLRMIELDLMG